ncbi:hypothetical protein Tco_1366910, partial [Tanacetum coccineum]
SVEIDRLKQTLSEHLKEKESLMQTVTLLKNDFKKEKSRNIDKEIALEKKIKQLDNIVFKRDQSAQTIHMLTKPQFFYDHTTKQALGFQNPFYLKKAQQLEPNFYDGNANRNTSAIVILDSEETLLLAEEIPEQAFWSKNSPKPTLSSRPTKVEVLKELPKVSMVNTSLKKLKYHLAGFDMVVKERTTPTAITEGSWGFEHTKACFRDEIIPFVKALKDLFNAFNQYLIDELSKVQNIFHQMEQVVEQHRLESISFKVKMNQLYDSIKPVRIRSKEQCDNLINQVNLKSVEISDLNASLQENFLEITALKDDLRKLNGKALVDNVVTKHTIDPEMLMIDVEPITPKLLNTKTAHSAYIKHTQEEATVLRNLIEHVKSKYPLDHSLESAYSGYDSKEQGQKRVKPSTSASGSQPSGNTKKDKIRQTSSRTTHMQHSKLNANSELKYVKCNGCMLSDNHDLCVLDFINNANARNKSKSIKQISKRKVCKPTGKVFTNIGYIWRPTGRIFTIVGNACPLTRRQYKER